MTFVFSLIRIYLSYRHHWPLLMANFLCASKKCFFTLPATQGHKDLGDFAASPCFGCSDQLYGTSLAYPVLLFAVEDWPSCCWSLWSSVATLLYYWSKLFPVFETTFLHVVGNMQCFLSHLTTCEDLLHILDQLSSERSVIQWSEFSLMCVTQPEVNECY